MATELTPQAGGHPVPNFAWSHEHPGNTGHDFRFFDRAHQYPLHPLINLGNPVVLAGRVLAWLRATPGFFWAPCSLCGLYSGGHEWDIDGDLPASVPTGERGHAQGICPWCTRAGRGWEEAR